MSRGALVFSLLVVALFAGFLWAYAGTACASSASCAATTTVNGTRYLLGVGKLLVGVEGRLTEVGSVTPGDPLQFADGVAYALDGVDPAGALVARTAPQNESTFGEYTILWGPDDDLAFPGICSYLQFAPGLPARCSNAAPSGAPS